MIIDATQEFKLKFLEFRKAAQQSQDEKINQQTKGNQQKDHQFKENISVEYQLSLKYAKSVYLSLSKIDQILKEKKQNYFSNAAYSLSSFTNQQRNQFDEETKAALKMCSDQINQLNTSSQKLIENNKSSKKQYNRNTQTYALHLKQVILCLHHYFKKLQAQFGEFLKYNELKKQKILRQYSIINSTLSLEPQKAHTIEPQYFQKRSSNINQQPSQSEQINAELQKEAHLFYLQKIQDQKKALQTKQTIESISSMLEQMGKKVLDQELLTSSFQQIGSVGLSFIDQGNRNLLQANNLSKSSGYYWVMLFLGLAFSLLFVDFLKS